MKQVMNKVNVPKNIYSRICKNPACTIPFECFHGNRAFCSERCKRNYERDLKKADREKSKRIEDLMKRATAIFEEHLQSVNPKITMKEMKLRNIDPNIYTVRLKSLKGEIIYVFGEYVLNKIGENEFLITKTQ
jgi:hypothetical protein